MINFKNLNSSDETFLTSQIVAGDKEAFYQFYKSMRPRLERYVATKVSVKKDREEIIQDAFIAFLDALPLFNHKSSLWTFLVSITRHEIADYYRRLYAKRAIKSVPLIHYLYDRRLAGSTKTAQDLNQMVEDVYSRLTPKYENILRMKYERDYSVKKIARRLKMTPKAAESLLYRARIAFQQVYSAKFGQPAFSVVKD